MDKLIITFIFLAVLIAGAVSILSTTVVNALPF